jgi:hypothetical protein
MPSFQDLVIFVLMIDDDRQTDCVLFAMPINYTHVLSAYAHNLK